MSTFVVFDKETKTTRVYEGLVHEVWNWFFISGLSHDRIKSTDSRYVVYSTETGRFMDLFEFVRNHKPEDVEEEAAKNGKYEIVYSAVMFALGELNYAAVSTDYTYSGIFIDDLARQAAAKILDAL